MSNYPQTQQEVFDTVATHLFKQGMQSRSNDGCAYRAIAHINNQEVMLKCAVGALIPDWLYTESMEGHSVHGLLSDLSKSTDVPTEAEQELYQFLADHEDLLTVLQEAHDHKMEHSLGVNDHSFLATMLAIAQRFGLNEIALRAAHQAYIRQPQEA